MCRSRRDDDFNFPTCEIPETPDLVIARRLLATAMRRSPPPPDCDLVIIKAPSAAWVTVLSTAVGTDYRGRRISTILRNPESISDRGNNAKVINKVMENRKRLRISVLISADDDWPTIIQRSADHRLDAWDLGRQLPGVPPEMVPQVTPLAVEFAHIEGQSRAEFTDRLLRLLDAPAAAARAGWSLDNLHGANAAVAWGRSLCVDVAAYKSGVLPWADVDKGCLLVGPPGCGKTTFASALSASSGLPLIAASFSKWDSAGKDGYLANMTRAMREDFETAKKLAPCLLFIDEVDSIPSRNTTGRNDEYWRAVVNCLLECLDGLGGREGVVVVAATNDDRNIDPAIKRSGRLDRVIQLGLPDASALARIMSVHLGEAVASVDLQAAAKAGVGGSGADCERWCRGARRSARSAGREVRTTDLLTEIRGAEDTRGDDERWRVAVHEAGHAVIMSALGRHVEAVSVRQMGQFGGTTEVRPPTVHGTAADVHDLVVGILAGRAAEEVIVGQITAGSSSDLRSATALVASAIAAWGLGGGLSYRGDPVGTDVDHWLSMNGDLRAPVELRLADAYADAVKAVRTARTSVVKVAEELMTRETLDAAELKAVLQDRGGHRPVEAAITVQVG